MKNREVAQKSETVFRNILVNQTQLAIWRNPERVNIEPNEVDKYFIIELTMMVLCFGVFVMLAVVYIQNVQLGSYLRQLM